MRSGPAAHAGRSQLPAPVAVWGGSETAGSRAEGSGRRRSDENGTGVVASVFGVGVFLALLMLAVQVAFVLYARSTVSAAAFDAARLVSGAPAAQSGSSQLASSQLASSEAAATAHLRTLLGGYGNRAVVKWQVGAREVSVTVTMRLPMLLPLGVPGGASLADVQRKVVLQRELVP